MAAELRWILLGLSLVLLAGIWWWGARRSQAAGNAELRESMVAKVAQSAPAVEPEMKQSFDEDVRDWGVPPFEPLSIRTADFEKVPTLDGPMLADEHPFESYEAQVTKQNVAPAAPRTVALSSRAAMTPAPPSATARVVATLAPVPAAPVPAAPMRAAPNESELQRIVTVRVIASGETRWLGTQLMAAFELHGLAYGRYQVYHRNHVDGRSLFCAASLIEPGTFDLEQMPDQEFRGVMLFAVLPGPSEPLLTVDELLSAARGLAEELSGVVQDAKGMPMSPPRASALRDDIARFQALLPRA